MKRLLFILIFFVGVVNAQEKSIFGFIKINSDIPLFGASVYLNNTSIGTYTDEDGLFELKAEKGVYQIVISYIGFETKTITINTETYKSPTTFKLSELSNMLDEIVVKSAKKKKLKKRIIRRYLKRFEEAFIGQSEIARNCEILNPEVIDFSYIEETKTIVASADKPIKIKNEALGYLINYDLKYINISDTEVAYLGYSKYEPLTSKRKSELKKWNENRKKAYLGSKQHFLKSLIFSTTKESGFTMDIVDIQRNPRKSTAAEVKEANGYITEQKRKGGYADFSKRVEYPVTKLDSAVNIMIDQYLDETITVLKTKNVKESEVLFPFGGSNILKFPKYLQVTYHKEKEDRSFKPKKSQKNFQQSVLQLLTNNAVINNNGTIQNPMNVRVTGYWAFEQIGDEVPLDYKLPKS